MADQNNILRNIDEGVYQLVQKQGKSAVWGLFAEIKRSDGSTLEGFVYCRKCKHLMKFNGRQTTNLLRHKCFASASELHTGVKKVRQEDKESAINACAQWIVEDGRPLIAIQGTGFAKLAAYLIKIGSMYGENHTSYKI